MTTWMSVPWRWASDAVPSLDLVEASRYFPGGRYDPALLGDWWPFLLASLITYGLLPRVVLWLVAERRGRRLAAGLALDHGDARAVYQRLTSGWAADIDCEGPAGVAVVVPGGLGPSVADLCVGACLAFAWADVPLAQGEVEDLVERRTGCRQVVVAAASSRVADAALGSVDALVVVAEAWEAPTRALGRYLAGLRRQVTSSTPIVVLLVGASTQAKADRPIDEADAGLWRRHLEGLGDPYLFVDAGVPG